MPLDLSPLQKALVALEQTVSRSEDRELMSSLDEVTQRAIRAGVIQHFEFTFELCWKFMQRWIRVNRSPEDAEPRTRKDLFRLAARVGLISDPLPWFEYAEARNLTSHTYNEAEAMRVYGVAVKLPSDARFLLVALEQAND